MAMGHDHDHDGLAACHVGRSHDLVLLFTSSIDTNQIHVKRVEFRKFYRQTFSPRGRGQRGIGERKCLGTDTCEGADQVS